ncbi:MAG: LysM domain-containing protein, partial [Angelakisella sp.]
PQEIPAPQEVPAPRDMDNLASDINNRVLDRLGKSKDGLLKLFSAPRKPQKEIEEDIAKFGGLEDEPEPKHAAPHEKPHPLAILYPAMRYGYETYYWAHTECYYIGIQVLRNLSDLRRRAYGVWVWAHYNIPAFVRKHRRRIAGALDAITDSCLHPFRDISAKTRHMQSDILHLHDSKREGTYTGKTSTTGVFFRYLYSLAKPLNSIASFILPIIGCAILAAVILYFQQLSYALEVEYSGVQLGYVAREGDFYEAKSKVYDRLINEEYAPPDNGRPTFRLVITDKENLTSTEALANKIMTVSKNEVAMADGIYIDGAFLGAVDDGSDFLFYIDSILDSYRTGTANERVQFVKKVGLQHGMYPISSIRPVHEIKNALESNETLPQMHKVAKGETLETIAEKNNTTVKDIIKLNENLQIRAEEGLGGILSLSEGEEILVNKVELSLGIQVTRRETYSEEIDYGTDYTDNNKEMENYIVTL